MTSGGRACGRSSALALPILLSAAMSLALPGCGGGGGSGSEAAPAVTAAVLATGTYHDRYPYQYLRLSSPGKADSYAIWFPPPGVAAGAKAPAVLLTDPYAGIDWTGEALDAEAYKRANSPDFVMIEDKYGPYFSAADPTYVPYDYSSIDNAGGFAVPYLINGIGAIIAYERFYAGGTLQNDIDDTLSALEYLSTQPEVDTKSIGVWGSSYGGSLALYAAANAAKGLKPVYGALSTPLVDYAQFVPYAEWQEATHADRGLAILRLEPFRRRALAAATSASGVVDYAPYSTAALMDGRLKTKFLFIHDTFDTISPLLEASTLYFGTPGVHQVFIYPHQGVELDWAHFDIGHAPVQPGYEEGSAVLFSQAYLLTRLSTSSTEVLLPRFATLDLSVFAYLSNQQTLGYDAKTYVLPRLLELCDPRVQLVDYAGYVDNFKTRESGRHFVAGLLKTYWHFDVDETNVVDRLQSKGLDP